MIDTILDFIKVLVAASPTLVLCVAAKKLNLKPPYRVRQFLMPLFALAYVVVTMIFCQQICDGILSLINNLPAWLESLKGWMEAQSWMPDFLFGIVDWLKNSLETWLKNLNMDFWIFFIANFVLIAGFLIYKKITVSILNAKFKRGGALMEKVTAPFYEYFAERDIWCLRNSFVDARTLLHVFYVLVLSVSFVLMISSRWLYFEDLLKTVYFPVFGVITIGELYFALGGVTKTEYSNIYLGESDDAYRTVNYSLLRKFLRTLFGDKLGCENTTINSGVDYDYTNDELIEKIESDEDPKISTFGIFIKSLNANGFPLDHNCIRSAVELLKGKSILFNDPFYYDLIPYAFYPMNRKLLAHQKVLVVLGRHAVEEDIIRWLKAGIGVTTNIPDMWNIGVLSEEYDSSLDVGIISRSDVLNTSLHEANKDFLSQVGFFVIIEPSRLVATAQLGLNLIIKKCRNDKEKEIVFCMCDKNCDGLVDAMSHILMTSITEVSATGKHTGACSYMTWNSDSEYLHHRLFPNVSRYLGIGTELSFAGLKNLVSRTTWYGGEAFPVTDIKWIDRQYYYELMQYAGLPANQEFMDEVFVTSSGYWDAQACANNYITVEDESCNLFEVVRDFSTRATEQGFVNVITREYMLKDYMVSNHTVFETDSKAIPYISADYARTERNTTLRLLLSMSSSGINEDSIKKEFLLMGVEVFAYKEQLWYQLYRCFADVASISSFAELAYPEAVKEAAEEKISLPGVESIGIDVISITEQFNLDKGKYEKIYRITDQVFLNKYISELRSAGIVAEDEKGDRYYLGSELKNQVFQKYLPGQFFTFGGKYYEIQGLTSDDQVLVRRAADHIADRCSYRQIRGYSLLGFSDSRHMGDSKTIGKVSIVKQFADISIVTKGYYDMSEYNNFETAQKVVFNEGSGIPERLYKNKEILRIDFPEDEPITDSVRYTVTLMMNEIFRTLFAENQPYIAAVTDLSFIGEDESCNPLTYSLDSAADDYRPNSIYILEDSQLDLGLIIAVERNLNRIFDIINDYIAWHLQELNRSLRPVKKTEPVQVLPPAAPDAGDGDKPKKMGFFKRLIEKIKNFFGGRKKPEEKPEDQTDEIPEGGTDGTPDGGTDGAPDGGTDGAPDGGTDGTPDGGTDGTPDGGTDDIPDGGFEPLSAGEPQIDPAIDPAEPFDGFVKQSDPAESGSGSDAVDDGSDIGTVVPPEENCFRRKTKSLDPASFTEQDEEPLPELFKKAPYHTRYYLLYGQQGEPSLLDIKGTGEYISSVFRNKNNTLRQVRDGRKTAMTIERRYRPNRANARFCDFCGVEILGVEYETLADGRDRCINCSRTAVKTVEDLVRIFNNVKRNMESSFGVKIQAGVRVELVNTRTLQKEAGNVFVPTKGFDPRVVGLAVHNKDGFRLLVETGAPRIRTILTIAHELTHIWQYQNWNRKKIRSMYGKALELEIYEGMAKWAEIQYAYLINEIPIAKREEINTAYRNDEYGRGFLRFRMNYPLTIGTVITGKTPFMNPDCPLALLYCGDVYIPEEFIRVPETDPDAPEEDPDYDDLFTEDDTDDIADEAVFEGAHDRDPDSLCYYAYEHLGAEEKKFYDQLYQAMLDRAESVHLMEGGIRLDRAQMIADCILDDHPELIWVKRGLSYYSGKELHNDFFLKYVLTPEQTESRLQEIEAAVPQFIEGITDGMCDFEAVLRVYNNLIRLTDYDSVGLEKEKAEPDAVDDLRSVYGVLVNHKGVCAGYAVAFAYLMHRIGIECMYVHGKAAKEGGKRFTENHAWNLVKLENEYYYMDVTWGDFSDTKPEKNQSDEISYQYFCVTSKELAIDHKLDEKFPYYPDCTATACNYYVRTGMYCETYDFERLKNMVLKAVESNKKSIGIKFSSASELKKAVKEVVDGSRFYEILQAVNLKLGKTVNSSSYSYSIAQEHGIIRFTLKYL